jgi:S-adenosyl-L-methionine hydrolase (adenosine-forming)
VPRVHSATHTLATLDCITFLTDYGLAGGFVGVCHGVAARLAPHARVVDLSHGVPPQDVRTAAVILAQSIDYLPRGVHVAVVDPGVGTERRGVAVAGGHGFFVGPDNGLLTWAFPPGDVTGAWELTNDELFLRPVTWTFHGRDIFMPVAAYLCNGGDPGSLGPAVDPAELVRLPSPHVSAADGVLETEVLIVDRFGNVQLAARRGDLEDARLAGERELSVELDGRRVTVPLVRTFGEVPKGALLVYEDSSGRLALAAHSASAAAELRVSAGGRIRLSVA